MDWWSVAGLGLLWAASRRRKLRLAEPVG
jgi:hypothetical protein